MFTGLVECTGTASLELVGASARLKVAAPALAPGVSVGESIAVNGCCLTVARIVEATLGFDVLEETLRRTNLGSPGAGGAVNLERALAANARLGGHFVQGHVDCTAPLLAREPRGEDLVLRFALPSEFARYVVFKGSIAVNGASLTVAEFDEASFTVWIIPHTRELTNLGALRPGDAVNLEFDILAKTIERLLDARAGGPGKDATA